MDEFITRFGLGHDALMERLHALTPAVLSSLSVIFFVIIFYLITSRLLEAALRKTSMQRTLILITVRSLYRSIIIILGIILVLNKLGINVTAAVAGIGVLGIAAGFAAQATLANVFSGFGIFIDHLYRAGDWVTINDYYGEVVGITLRTTKIRTLDNTYVSIPNSLVTSTPVTNFSEQGEVRVTAKVGIAYAEEVTAARTALVAAAKRIPGIRKDISPEVVVEALGDSSVKLLVRIWIDEARQEQKFGFILTETCKQALDAAKITIPFPQRDIHIIDKATKKNARKKVGKK
jgi:small conductance mechanosensitive channel